MVALSVAVPAAQPVEARPPVEAQPLGAPPTVWVLHDGKAGMASQALGVAEAAGFPFVEKPLTVRRPWLWAAPSLWIAPLLGVTQSGAVTQSGGVTQSGRRLTPPWPDAVIGCGRNAVRPALAI